MFWGWKVELCCCASWRRKVLSSRDVCEKIIQREKNDIRTLIIGEKMAYGTKKKK